MRYARARSIIVPSGLLSVLLACTPATTDPPDVRTPQADTRSQQTEPPSQEPPATLDSLQQPSESARTGEAAPRPDWLGTRILPREDDGFGQRLPTPPELIDRRLETPPLPFLPAPQPGDERFVAEITTVPDRVAERSTWNPACPVPLEVLRYVTVRFFGFDGRVHAGELIVHEDVAHDIVQVFAELHELRFPLEEVRVIRSEELDAPPTGDGNVTSAFVCRPVAGGTRWSEHAYGRAIDINPFHNPYVRGDVIIPELAGSYTDRDDVRPGMVVPGDAVTQAFTRIGWGWGGDWTGAAVDPMHFSVSGR